MFIFLIYLEEEEKKYNLIVPSKCFFFFLVNCPPAVDEDNYSTPIPQTASDNGKRVKKLFKDFKYGSSVSKTLL